MATVAELSQAITDLQSTVDTVQQKVADAVTAFKQQIADLQAIIDSGSQITPEMLQPILDGMATANADLAATPTE